MANVIFYLDIFHLICDHCDEQTLSRLSRTNKDIQEIALNALWSELMGLGALVRCMPQDLWEEKPVETPSKESSHPRFELSIRRPIQSTDWTRFELNAARVRRFIADPITLDDWSFWKPIQSTDWTRLTHLPRFGVKRFVADPITPGRNAHNMFDFYCDTEVYEAIFSAARSAPLLPRAKQIVWNRRNDASFLHIKQLLSPFSQDLTLIWTMNSESRLLVLQGLVELQCMVTRFHVIFDREETTDLTEWMTVLSTISAWSLLQSLSITNIPASVIDLLFDLPALTDLKLDDCWHLDGVTAIPPSTAKGFRCLKHLAVRFCSLAFGLRLIKATLRAPLQTLDIWSNIITYTKSWLELFMSMRDHLPPQSLREISVRSYCISFAPATLDLLSSLFTFNRLTKLVVIIRDSFYLEDNEIEFICSTWPCLHTLDLGPRVILTERGIRTMVCLRSILEHRRRGNHVQVMP